MDLWEGFQFSEQEIRWGLDNNDIHRVTTRGPFYNLTDDWSSELSKKKYWQWSNRKIPAEFPEWIFTFRYFLLLLEVFLLPFASLSKLLSPFSRRCSRETDCKSSWLRSSNSTLIFGGFWNIALISVYCFLSAIPTGVSCCWFLTVRSAPPLSINIRTSFRRPIAAAMCNGESPFWNMTNWTH